MICSSEPLGMMRARTASHSRIARCSSSVCQPLRALSTAIFMVREKRDAAIRPPDVWPPDALARLDTRENDLTTRRELRKVAGNFLEAGRRHSGLERGVAREPE